MDWDSLTSHFHDLKWLNWSSSPRPLWIDFDWSVPLGFVAGFVLIVDKWPSDFAFNLKTLLVVWTEYDLEIYLNLKFTACINNITHWYRVAENICYHWSLIISSYSWHICFHIWLLYTLLIKFTWIQTFKQAWESIVYFIWEYEGQVKLILNRV